MVAQSDSHRTVGQCVALPSARETNNATNLNDA